MLARLGGFERYWVDLHGESLNRAEVQTILRAARPIAGSRIVLDAGCGEGRIAFGLAAMYERVHAIDFAEESCEQLRRTAEARRVTNIEVFSHDLLQPLPLRQVDAIVLAQVLQHFKQPSDRLTVLRHLRDCLRSGGRLVLTVFNRDRLWNRARGMAAEVNNRTGYPYYHFFRIRELEALLRQSGFDHIRTGGCINIPATLHERVSLARVDVALSSLTRLSRYFGMYLLGTASRAED